MKRALKISRRTGSAAVEPFAAVADAVLVTTRLPSLR
jgi:hypothetical protein